VVEKAECETRAGKIERCGKQADWLRCPTLAAMPANLHLRSTDRPHVILQRAASLKLADNFVHTARAFFVVIADDGHPVALRI